MIRRTLVNLCREERAASVVLAFTLVLPVQAQQGNVENSGSRWLAATSGPAVTEESAMSKLNTDIHSLTKENTDFRREILTNRYTQIVLMSVEPGDEIGEETHRTAQVLVFVEGEGEAVLDGERAGVREGSLVAVPAGTRHNFINTGKTPLKLYTIYGPPEEPPGTVHRTKAEAEAEEHR